MYRFLIYIICILSVATASAQKYPERGLVRKGNRAFEKQLYEKSLASYEEALHCDSTNFVTRYNMGNALIFAERYDRAAQLLSQAAADTTRMVEERAEAMFNLGNLHLSQQKLQEALDAYKGSLRLNPSDEQAKFNYVYVKRLMENNQNQQEQQNQDQQNQDQENQHNQQDKNQQNQQDQNDQNSDNNEGNSEEQEGDNQPQESENDDQDGDDEQGEMPVEPKISEEEQARMLDAIQAQEDKTQEKLKEKAKGVIIRGRKNW